MSLKNIKKLHPNKPKNDLIIEIIEEDRSQINSTTDNSLK